MHLIGASPTSHQVANEINRSAMHRQLQSPSLARLAHSNLFASRASLLCSANNKENLHRSVDGTFDGLRDRAFPLSLSSLYSLFSLFSLFSLLSSLHLPPDTSLHSSSSFPRSLPPPDLERPTPSLFTHLTLTLLSDPPHPPPQPAPLLFPVTLTTPGPAARPRDYSMRQMPKSPATPAADPIDFLNDGPDGARYAQTCGKEVSLVWGNDDDAAFGMLTPLDERTLRHDGVDDSILTPNFGATYDQVGGTPNFGENTLNGIGGTPMLGPTPRFARETPGAWLEKTDSMSGSLATCVLLDCSTQTNYFSPPTL